VRTRRRPESQSTEDTRRGRYNINRRLGLQAEIVGFETNTESHTMSLSVQACSVHSGEAAMSTFRDGREQCRALLTDVNLGDGISGWELARQIREITPGFPVVYMTSASAPDWKSQGVDGSLLIEKPFAPAQLAAAVSQLLDTGA
jgi:DNA-binding response OmpR family regulator